VQKGLRQALLHPRLTIAAERATNRSADDFEDHERMPVLARELHCRNLGILSALLTHAHPESERLAIISSPKRTHRLRLYGHLETALELRQVRFKADLVAIQALDAVGLEHAVAVGARLRRARAPRLRQAARSARAQARTAVH
jgi:hypothetical protein